jgi:hypothetical protein
MSTLTAPARPGPAPDGRAPAADLLAGLVRHPWGQVSPSVYETARLVTLAPWLPGHDARVRFLVDGQRADGAWGGPGGYALVPTLSAVEALLTALRRPDAPVQWLVPAVDRGLRALAALGADRDGLPDTPAIEVIVPALRAAVNAHLAGGGPARWSVAGPLPGPAGALRLPAGQPLAIKLLHSLEVAAPLAGPPPGVRPTAPGTVGASPAATAAWLAAQPADRRDLTALGFLWSLADRYGGAVPSVVPITVFERSWVLTSLADAGRAAPPDLLADLRAGLGPDGTPGGAGLPPDADTTSVVLALLERTGAPADLDCLLGFDTGTHFVTWPGERTASVTTNAHVLAALGARLRRRPGQATRYGAAADRIAAWLGERQGPDGAWTDKWHASPYYATAAAVQALARVAGPAAARGCRRAIRWVLDTQRADGAWGRWGPTREETAYALLVLDHARPEAAPARAGARGRGWLRGATGDDPPLWHDKDLYRPTAVVDAAVLAASGVVRPAVPRLSTV